MVAAEQLPLVPDPAVPVDGDGKARFLARWAELGGGPIEVVSCIVAARCWVLVRQGKREAVYIRATPERCAEAAREGRRWR